MNEEKRQVLDLLQAGKITQDQAQRLLEALGEDPAPEPPVSGDFSPAAPGLPPRLAELQAAAQSKLEEALAQLQKAREALAPTTSCEEELEAQLEEAEACLEDADGAWDDLEAELDDADALWDDLEAELEDMEEELDSAPGANAQWETQWKAQWDAGWNAFRDQWHAQRKAAQAALEARQSPTDAPDKAPSKLDKALSKFQKATASLAARFPWAAPHPGQAGASDQAPPQTAEAPADLAEAEAQMEAAQTEWDERQAAQDEAQAALAEAQAQMDEVQGEWEAAQAEFAAYQIRTDDIEKAQNELHLEEEPAGPSGDEVGPQEDEVGPDGGETGPNPGDFGSNPGQNGSIPGDFCLYNPHVPAPTAPLIPLPLEPHSYELPTPGPISRLRINWVNGPVEVRPWEGDTLRLTEYSPRPLKEEERLALREENGQLTVQWTAKPAVSLGFRPFSLQKHLVVELPQTAPLEEIKVESVSGALYLTGFQAGKIKAQAVSGSVSCQGLWAEQLWAESASGAVRLASVSSRELEARSVSGRTELLGFSCAKLKGETISGSLTVRGEGEEVKLNTISGALCLELSQYPRTARLNTVSGKISLGLPQEGPGFTVEYDSVSGGFGSRFPLIGALKKRHGQAAFGQGGAALHLETVSGAMELYPLP